MGILKASNTIETNIFYAEAPFIRNKDYFWQDFTKDFLEINKISISNIQVYNSLKGIFLSVNSFTSESQPIEFKPALLKYMKSMVKKFKIDYTEEQINLLERSKILAIWTIPAKTYTNEYESKAISPIIIGYAVDTRDNTTYNWVVDLKQDVSVLFED